ncbi:MAG: hypothetical protein PQJ59_01795 [Spirochaetales bacterium]|nr:hypothetical protein [Spirochaetales bacterium]
MSLRSAAAAEFRENLTADGDTVTLTDEVFTDYELTGKVVRTDERIDPGTKERFEEPETRVTLAIADLPDEFAEDWGVSVEDETGETVEGYVRSPKYDRTLGFVTFIVEASGVC